MTSEETRDLITDRIDLAKITDTGRAERETAEKRVEKQLLEACVERILYAARQGWTQTYCFQITDARAQQLTDRFIGLNVREEQPTRWMVVRQLVNKPEQVDAGRTREFYWK